MLGRVVRRRGVMEPLAGNAEMVEPTAEVERGEKRRCFGGTGTVGKCGMAICGREAV